jgi:23S rRNA pseudouridine1911/1915/1917 synthase
MAIRPGHAESRPATTFFEIAERFDGFAAVRVFPKTGRTHQIRVHLAHIGHPVLCDRLYGGRAQISLGEIQSRRENAEIILDRQALHARRLRVRHPISQEPLEVVVPLPLDLERTLAALRTYRVRK